jgi:hypothetical protein
MTHQDNTPLEGNVTARSSLNGYWTQATHGTPEDGSIFGRLTLPDATIWNEDESEIVSAPGKLLEFPNPVGTEELNHFMVFSIYTGIEGTLDAENYKRFIAGEIEDLTWSASMAGASLLGGYLGTRYLTRRIPSTKVNMKGWAGVIGTLGTVGASYLAWAMGDDAANTQRTEEEKAQLKNFADTVGALAEQTEGGAWKQGDAIGSVEDGTYNVVGGSAPGEGGARVTRFGIATAKHQDTIAMYMPQKIQAMSLLEYEQQDMSFVHKLLDDWAGLAAGVGFTMLPKAADAVAGIFGQNTNINAAVYGAMRMAPNPRKQLMFREPVSRKFEFNFNLSPRNEKESAKAYEIIQTFKKHAYPHLNQVVGQGAYYTFPPEFEIKYYTLDSAGNPVENDFINKIGRCALREINVDYASSGSFSTFENGAPTNMILSLTFEEMELLDSGLIEHGY